MKAIKALACLSFAVLFVSLVTLGTSLPSEAKANLESTQQRPQLALADGLVDYWKMDEASGDFIGAANGKTFTAYGTVTNAVGKVYATARQFPGVGTSGAGIRDNNDVRFGDTDVTFTFWWYQYTQPLGAGNNLYHYIWHQDDYYGGYTIGVNRGDQVFMQSGSGNNQFDTLHSSAVSSPTNTWHLVIAWYDSTAKQLHMKVDNGQELSTSASPHAPGGFPARIGSSETTDNVMEGRIGPIAVWNRLLSPSEMNLLWNGGNGLAYPFTPPLSTSPTSTPTNTPTFTPTPTNTPTPTPANTGLLNPSSNTAQSGGDSNGFQTNPANAYASDSLFAVDTNSGTSTSSSCTSSGKDRHAFYTYNISLPQNATVLGVEARADARVDSTSGSPQMCLQLSWDGGVTWTTAKTTPVLSTSLNTYILGSSTDTWGRTWTLDNLSNANFRVRITNVATSTARDFSLDWLTVRITYRP